MIMVVFSRLHRKKVVNDIILLFGMAVFLGITSQLIFHFTALDHRGRLYLQCLFFLIVSFWIIVTAKHICFDIFNLYTVFIVSALLFHGGQAILHVFYLVDIIDLNPNINVEFLYNSIKLSALGIGCFHIGGLLGSRKKGLKDKIQPMSPYAYSSKSSARLVGLVLIMISVIPQAIEAIAAARIVWSGGYFALYEREVLAGLAGGKESLIRNLARFCVPGLLFFWAGSRHASVANILVFFSISFYGLWTIALGQRGHGTMVLIAALWSWHKLVKKLRIMYLFALGLCIVFLVFPTIKTIRDVSLGERLDLWYVMELFVSIENPFIMALTEMGGSIRTVAYTLFLVPAAYSFKYGMTYAYVASSIIPNFFWNLHPAVEYGSLNRWLTMTVDPFSFYRGGGLGYSFIAEAYANFGWVGTAIFMILCGFLLARLSVWPYLNRANRLPVAVVSVCMATMIMWVRNDFNFVFRPLVLYAFGPYYLCALVNYFSRQFTEAKRK